MADNNNNTEEETSPQHTPTKPKQQQKQKRRIDKTMRSLCPTDGTIVGTGTVGLGSGYVPYDANKAAFDAWKAQKREQQNSYPRSRNADTQSTASTLEPGYITPREVREHEKHVIEQLKELREQRRHDIQQRSEEEKARAKQSIAQQQAAFLENARDNYYTEREANRARREAALLDFATHRTEEIRQIRAQLKEERELWSQVTQEQKQREERQMMQSKKLFKESHDYAIQRRLQNQQLKLEAIHKAKETSKEHQQEWKALRDENNAHRKETTQEIRSRWQSSLEESKLSAREQKTDAVRSARSEFATVEQMRQERKKKREEQVREDTKSRKKEQESDFKQKMDAIHTARRQAAEEVRRQAAKGRHEREEEIRERQRAAALQRNEVRASLGVK